MAFWVAPVPQSTKSDPFEVALVVSAPKGTQCHDRTQLTPIELAQAKRIASHRTEPASLTGRQRRARLVSLGRIQPPITRRGRTSMVGPWARPRSPSREENFAAQRSGRRWHQPGHQCCVWLPRQGCHQQRAGWTRQRVSHDRYFQNCTERNMGSSGVTWVAADRMAMGFTASGKPDGIERHQPDGRHRLHHALRRLPLLASTAGL